MRQIQTISKEIAQTEKDISTAQAKLVKLKKEMQESWEAYGQQKLTACWDELTDMSKWQWNKGSKNWRGTRYKMKHEVEGITLQVEYDHMPSYHYASLIVSLIPKDNPKMRLMHRHHTLRKTIPTGKGPSVSKQIAAWQAWLTLGQYALKESLPAPYGAADAAKLAGLERRLATMRKVLKKTTDAKKERELENKIFIFEDEVRAHRTLLKGRERERMASTAYRDLEDLPNLIRQATFPPAGQTLNLRCGHFDFEAKGSKHSWGETVTWKIMLRNKKLTGANGATFPRNSTRSRAKSLAQIVEESLQRFYVRYGMGPKSKATP